MKTRKDYSKSPAPRYDALQDVIKFLADRWPKCNDYLKGVTNVDQFENWAGFAGVEGAPVEAWYDHIHGEGAWVIAGGTPQFSDGMALRPMTVRRAFTRDMLEDIQSFLNACVQGTPKAFDESHLLYNLSTDDLTSVEEWVQAMLERTEMDESEEDERLWNQFIEQIENKLIDRMVAKVLEQRERNIRDEFPIGYILTNLNPDRLFQVVDFLNSYKIRLED